MCITNMQPIDNEDLAYQQVKAHALDNGKGPTGEIGLPGLLLALIESSDPRPREAFAKRG